MFGPHADARAIAAQARKLIDQAASTRPTAPPKPPARPPLAPGVIRPTQEQIIAARLLFELDGEGNCVRASTQPAPDPVAAAIFLTQTTEMMRRGNELLWMLDHLKPRGEQPERRQGYLLCLEDIRAAEELLKLRHAISDLRGYLPAAAKMLGKNS